MNAIVSVGLLIAAIIFIIAAFVVRFLKFKTIGTFLELGGIAFFIAYSSQYLYLLGDLAHIDMVGIAKLLLFVFALLLGVYRAIFFFLLTKR